MGMYEVYELNVENFKKGKTERYYITVFGCEVLIAHEKPSGKLELKSAFKWNLSKGGKVDLKPIEKEEKKKELIGLIFYEYQKNTGIKGLFPPPKNLRTH